MSISEAVVFFDDLVDRNGPTPSDYETVGKYFDVCHKSEFQIQDGLSTRTNVSSLLEDFFTRNKHVFRTGASMQGFAYLKPHGYAGDFEIIERIYSQSASQKETLYNWDVMFHQNDAAKAVRNRAQVLNSLVRDLHPNSLLSVGSGPALDVVGAIDKDNEISRLSFVDNDKNALLRAKVNLTAAGLTHSHFEFHHKNALRFRSSDKHDLIWSSGLFDYLNEKVAIFLLRHLRGMLTKHGRIAIGNFSHNNPSRAYMELVGEWLLVHRSPEDLMRIALEAGFSQDNCEVIGDATGVNLFLIARNE